MFLSWTEVPLVPGVRLLSLSLSLSGILYDFVEIKQEQNNGTVPKQFSPKTNSTQILTPL